MTFLFDQNLSRALVARLADLFPGSVHVSTIGLTRSEDESVWDRAKQDDLVIVTKDTDFHQRAFLYGAPPKVVWIRLGNCSTNDVEQLIRARAGEIHLFLDDPEAALLALD